MVHQVFRFSSPNHKAWTASGFEGRWNRGGVKIVYAAENRALAKLEVLANQPSRLEHTLSRCEIPASVLDGALRVNALPETTQECRELCDDWVHGGRSALMFVPSAILPSEENVLLNPGHPHFPSLIWRTEAERFAFAQRLFWTPAIYDARQYQFFVSRRELLPEGRRPKPVASELGLISLMRAYRAGEDLRSLATLHGFEEQQLLEAVVYGLNLPEYRSPKPPA